MSIKCLALSCSIVLFGLFAIAGNNGLLHLQKLNNERDLLREKSDSLEQEITFLRRDIARIERHPIELERHAREELGLSRPGEIVYIFPKAE